MSYNIDEKELDKKISQYIKNKDLNNLKELLDLSEDDISSISRSLEENHGEFIGWVLEKILLARDKKVFNLNEVEISYVKMNELLKEDEIIVNSTGMLHYVLDYVTKVHGEDKNGKNIILYYGNNTAAKEVLRYKGMVNKYGDIDHVQEHILDHNGNCEQTNNILIAYRYDTQGKKEVDFIKIKIMI